MKSSGPSYVPSNPASAQVPAETSNWSAEPDRFVEKTQLEIRAEQEAARREASARGSGRDRLKLVVDTDSNCF